MWPKKRLGVGGKYEDDQSYLHTKSRIISPWDPATSKFSEFRDHDFSSACFCGGGRIISCFSPASFALTAFATWEVSSPAFFRNLYPTSESFKLSCGIFEASKRGRGYPEPIAAHRNKRRHTASVRRKTHNHGMEACHVMPTESQTFEGAPLG